MRLQLEGKQNKNQKIVLFLHLLLDMMLGQCYLTASPFKMSHITEQHIFIKLTNVFQAEGHLTLHKVTFTDCILI